MSSPRRSSSRSPKRSNENSIYIIAEIYEDPNSKFSEVEFVLNLEFDEESSEKWAVQHYKEIEDDAEKTGLIDVIIVKAKPIFHARDTILRVTTTKKCFAQNIKFSKHFFVF